MAQTQAEKPKVLFPALTIRYGASKFQVETEGRLIELYGTDAWDVFKTG